MGVTTHQLLQPGMGLELPADVRRSLTEMGAACNQCAVHLHNASSHSLHIESIMEAHRTSEHALQPALGIVTDLQRLADQHFEQAIVVLARSATAYAVYASQVAGAVAAGRTPPLPGSQKILPSDLITACGHYLPEVRFNDNQGQTQVVMDQNTAVDSARRRLINLITYQLQGADSSAYDDIATVTLTDDPGDQRLVAFAATLHEYASVLVWAIGIFSGALPDGDDSPVTG